MSTLSDQLAPPSPPDERRLHPLSWLFVLLQQLRSFAIPIVVVIVTGRDSREWIGLISVAVLTLISVAQYFTYRYRADADGFVIRSGVFQRTSRDIPYERIHTVNLHQTLLHRLFSVTEVRLESAGSKDAEAVMSVLSMADAQALETFVRERSLARRVDPHTTEAPVAATTPETPLLTLGTMEIVRLGLISNRGMVVVAAAFGVLWQFMGDGRLSSESLPGLVRTLIREAGRFVSEHLHDLAGLALAGLLVLIPLLVLVRLLSVALALLQFHGFSLVEVGRQLRVERGLLTRVRNQLPRRRIQAWRIDETLLHRWFGRQSVRVDSAAGGDGDDDRGVRHLAPIATPAVAGALVRRVMAKDVWPPAEWQPLHARAWRRMFVVPSTVVTIAAAVAAWHFGPAALVLLAVIPLLVVRAQRLARFAGYAVADDTIVIRSGWLNRQWELADIRKLQALRLTESPLDRRHGMATLWLDTAGASTADGVLRIRYMPVDQARSLFDWITGQMDERHT